MFSPVSRPRTDGRASCDGRRCPDAVLATSAGGPHGDTTDGSAVALHPAAVLLGCSVPFCVGAYLGFRQPVERLEAMLEEDAAKQVKDGVKDKVANLQERRAVGVSVASRALRVATLSTLGTFGLVGAVAFYLSGHRTIQEASAGTRRWASSKRRALEEWLDWNDRPSVTDPEVVAMKGMTEQEQLSYLYDRYLRQQVEEDVERYEDAQRTETASDDARRSESSAADGPS